MNDGDGVGARSGAELWRLAWPAFLALVAEPLFLLGDSVVVGHLGTSALAGLGIAATVLQTAVGLCVFLAYGTTAAVARRLGAGDRRGALAGGVDGLWLAVLIGLATTVVGVLATSPLVDLFGVTPDVAHQARTYLRLAFLGTTPLLVMLAATGVLRGLQDTRTPLVVAVGGNALNLALNVLLVSLLGIAGSAIGSVVAQVLSAGVLVGVLVRAARREDVGLRPAPSGLLGVARTGVALVVRTLTLRAALVATTWAVASGGTDAEVATHQLAMTLWTFLAFALDAVAIAAQALTGRHLGAGDVVATRAVTRHVVRWGLAAGVGTGVLLAGASPVLGRLFTSDAEVRHLLVPVLLVAALGQPVAGVVFVLDGVLIGAGDGRYLALAGLVVLAVYGPVVLALRGTGLVPVWAAFAGVLMLGRMLTLLARERGEAWLRLGPTLSR